MSDQDPLYERAGFNHISGPFNWDKKEAPAPSQPTAATQQWCQCPSPYEGARPFPSPRYCERCHRNIFEPSQAAQPVASPTPEEIKPADAIRWLRNNKAISNPIILDYGKTLHDMPKGTDCGTYMAEFANAKVREALTAQSEAREKAEARLADLAAKLEERELELRTLMWLNHGHFAILYGDDGEMQCSACRVIDYKRAPLDDVRAAYQAALLSRLDSTTPQPKTEREG